MSDAEAGFRIVTTPCQGVRLPYFEHWGALPACWGKGSRRGCLVVAFKTSNGVADGAPSFEAVVYDPDQRLDHWDEIDTITDFDEAE
ncbi:MAG: hypothetical protein O7E53_01955 [Alphaproteobacteria bacterium]|nr:hypothetical protein [Alphaproteobacteria bacterium]